MKKLELAQKKRVKKNEDENGNYFKKKRKINENKKFKDELMDDIKLILRKNNIKIKSFDNKQIEFYNKQDLDKANSILSKRYSFKIDNKNILLSNFKKSIKEETQTGDIAVTPTQKISQRTYRRQLWKDIEESVNYKDIVKAFDIITNVSVKKNILIVTGKIANKQEEKTYEYSSPIITKTIAQKVKNFIDIK